MEDSSGFKVLEKKSLSNTDFLTSTKLQISTQPFPSATCTHHHGINLHRPFVGDDDDGGANEAASNIYRHGAGIFPSTIQYRPQGMMVGFPFTGAQMKELEQQALIYKYMISSVPVPIHLLPQLSRNFPDSSLSSIYGGRYAKNGDPEPGRCKRTDGKKWRCSKEVAPQQKYCERHLHRGRPRSRKPVELKDQNHKKTRLVHQNQNQNQNKSLPTAKSDSVSANEPILLLNAKTDLTISTPPYYNREGRIVASEQPWESDCYIPQQYVDEQQPLNHIFSYPNLPTGGFIDAWSIDNLNARNTKHAISSSLNDGDLDLYPSLNLSMAMAAGDIVDREVRSINVEDHKAKDAMWLGPVSWGPLGEALAVGGSTPASPSGVLHWTLFSDNSVCNSPTFVAPPSEGSNQGHN